MAVRVDEGTQRRVVRELVERYDVDIGADCHKLVMGWDEVRTLAADPLVTIGAHTKGHFAVAKLSDERAYDEMVGGADRLNRSSGSVRPISVSLMAIPAAPGRATSRWRSRPASRPR